MEYGCDRELLMVGIIYIVTIIDLSVRSRAYKIGLAELVDRVTRANRVVAFMVMGIWSTRSRGASLLSTILRTRV